MKGLFLPRNRLLTNWPSNQIFLLQTFSRDFQSPPPLQIFLLDWNEFPLVTAVAGVEKEKEFDGSLQLLKYSDPLLEVPTFLESVSVFLLSEYLEVDSTRIIFLAACEHMVIFLVESELASPWKRLFCLLLFCNNFDPAILFVLQGPFLKGLVSTCSVFRNSTCKQLFWLLVSLLLFPISAWNSLPKRSLYSFWSNSDLFFSMDFACVVLFITPSRALRRLWYDRAMFVCPTSIILW